MLIPHGECWVITDDAAGNQRQALALAEMLKMPFRHLVVAPRAPWSWLAPRLVTGSRLALPPDQRRVFAPPWPRVAIGCGRQSALFTRQLARLSGGRCHAVQILDPRVDTSHWGTVIAPRHDRVRGPNVLQPIGSLNGVDERWLEDGRDGWRGLAELPQPRLGVLVGGPRRGIGLDDDYARQFARALLEKRKHEGGSLLLMASRRTPGAVIELLQRELGEVPGLLWTGPQDGANPYPGVLGWADRLVVTPDSVNMLSEACAVGRAVAHVCTRGVADKDPAVSSMSAGLGVAARPWLTIARSADALARNGADRRDHSRANCCIAARGFRRLIQVGAGESNALALPSTGGAQPER